MFVEKASVIPDEFLICFTGGKKGLIIVLKAEIFSLVLPTLNLFFSSHFILLQQFMHLFSFLFS